jgi:hypothetical protein
MHILSRHACLFSAAIFACVLALHVAFKEYEDVPTFLVVPAIIALTGITAAAMGLYQLWKKRNASAAVLLLGEVAIFLAWGYTPTDEIGRYVRFNIDLPMYRTAIGEVSRGNVPRCAPKECMIEKGDPTYLVFPWGGLLSSWVGVVYDPTDNLRQFVTHKPTFTGEIMGCTQIRRNFFLCGFA